MACRLDPRTGFQMAGEWLKYQLTAPVDTGPMNCKLSRKKIRIWFLIQVKMELLWPFLFCEGEPRDYTRFSGFQSPCKLKTKANKKICILCCIPME